ncbi:MAG: hypothetical protein RM049_23385 [Nostoc sp. DedQUE04]|uniref:helix-turn-helix domain-containing protein n=1 Tax=Nostoc sp. DedQUE04 TaxID=3075390 RepID=UPI002AD293B7|nr:hypothetical protein [Nostoc sp. DedQUE04]MDZ8138213.1 hypothetical protein [Nostoc sp. DedQUE04]
MSNKQHGYADGRAFPIFIDRELDDFGLDPYQFRIYARIARRAGERGAYESIKNMATGCQMSEGKVKTSLKVLIECGLVTKESCVGGTSIYRLTDKAEWIQSSKDLRSKRGHSATQDATCLPTQDATDLPPGRNVSTPQDATCPQRYSIEDTPVKGTPIEEDPPIVPQNFLKEEGGGLDLDDRGIESIEEPNSQIITALPSNLESTRKSNIPSSGSIIRRSENNYQNQNLNPIQQAFEDSGKVLSYGIEYKTWIQTEIGDVIKHYRQSGRALTVSPNDIDPDFKSFTAANANGGKGLKLAAAQGWIVNCEKDPLRWGELRDLVAEWLLAKKTGDRHTSIAQEINRASKPKISLNLNY